MRPLTFLTCLAHILHIGEVVILLDIDPRVSVEVWILHADWSL